MPARLGRCQWISRETEYGLQIFLSRNNTCCARKCLRYSGWSTSLRQPTALPSSAQSRTTDPDLYPATESLRDSPVRYALLYHVSILTQAVEKMRGRDASACDDHLHDPSVPFHFTEDHGVSLEDDKEIATSVSALTTCALGEGSACGCCGNYSGCCSVSSYLCYLHDQSCESCGWWCGWQCVPGSC